MSKALSTGAGFRKLFGVLGVNPFTSGLPGKARTPRIGVNIAGLVGVVPGISSGDRPHPEVRREGREPLPDHAGESPLLSRSGGDALQVFFTTEPPGKP